VADGVGEQLLKHQVEMELDLFAQRVLAAESCRLRRETRDFGQFAVE
jgi:hypothetical protein